VLNDKKTLADKLLAMEQGEAQRFNEKLFSEREKIRVLEHSYDTLRNGTEGGQSARGSPREGSGRPAPRGG
jgi:hypothetical protein